MHGQTVKFVEANSFFFFCNFMNMASEREIFTYDMYFLTPMHKKLTPMDVTQTSDFDY